MSIVAAIKWWWLYPLSHELEVHQAIMRIFTPRLITSREEAAERALDLDAFEVLSAKQFHAGKLRDVLATLRKSREKECADKETHLRNAAACDREIAELDEIIAAYEPALGRLG